MNRLLQAGAVLLYIACLALGIYEVTAKSPSILGARLPGWWAADQAEHATRWDPPTGLMPLDKVLHESEEAVRFYAALTGIQATERRTAYRYPTRALRSSKSASSTR